MSELPYGAKGGRDGDCLKCYYDDYYRSYTNCKININDFIKYINR